jgi:aryl-alcohol dehydrogenase-like predicted oxidoreductase
METRVECESGTPTDTVPATEAIRRAADRGVTLFDTAQGYGFGESERLLAAALGQLAP